MAAARGAKFPAAPPIPAAPSAATLAALATAWAAGLPGFSSAPRIRGAGGNAVSCAGAGAADPASSAAARAPDHLNDTFMATLLLEDVYFAEPATTRPGVPADTRPRPLPGRTDPASR